MNLWLKNISAILCLALLLIFSSCDGEDEDFHTPKPRGYFRIDFPEKAYQKYDTACPFTFDYPVYGKVVADKNPSAEPCWINIEFPQYKGSIHLSYKKVNNNIEKYLEDSRNLVVKHTVKASAIDEQIIVRDSAKVYGLMYDIKGNTASSLQFYLTDSTEHFIRGALYFNSVPNQDSLGVVIEFIRKDVHQLIKSFHWKE